MARRSNGIGVLNPGLKHLPAAEPVVLEGAHVRLEPLRLSHLDSLCEVGLDPDLWKWIPNPVYSR